MKLKKVLRYCDVNEDIIVADSTNYGRHLFRGKVLELITNRKYLANAKVTHMGRIHTDEFGITLYFRIIL